MLLLSASGLSKAYGVMPILEDVTFQVNKGDRIGVVGVNGAGKSTLLNLLAGELVPDQGTIYKAADLKVGYLKQRDRFSWEKTVYEEMMELFRPLLDMEREMERLSAEIAAASAAGQNSERLLSEYDLLSQRYENGGGYVFRSEITGILNSMAFPEDTWNKPCALLSGGENTRLALAALLLQKPDLLLLDEPTNHLDIGTLKWLESYLQNYNGSIVLISHDRYFLDQTVNRIFEVESHKLTAYKGNYTEYKEKKAARLEDDLKHYQQQQQEIARQEEIIRRFKGHNTEKLVKRAQSREKRLAQMERLDKPEIHSENLNLRFKENYASGTDVLFTEDLAMSFPIPGGNGRRQLFDHVQMDVKRGERVCMVGANGIGKSTLLKIVTGELLPDSGYMRLGHNVSIGYYDQEQRLLSGSNTVLEEIHSAYRLYTETELRGILGRFLFHGDDVFKQVSQLSGGEKARLSLLKLMLSGDNFLLLDEPTNHLDIQSKEVFEEALLQFPGTLLIISHDRYLLNRVPTRLVELTPEGMVNYLGNYDYYQEKKASLGSGKQYLGRLNKGTAQDGPAAAPKGSAPGNAGSQSAGGASSPAAPAGSGCEAPQAAAGSAERRQQEKAQESARRRQQRQKEALEKEIRELEESIQLLNGEMSDPANASDFVRLRDCAEKQQALQDRLDAAYEAWVELEG